MSLETTIADLVSAANNLTSSVNGKMNEIDQKVDQATEAVPSTIRDLASQSFYIDAVGGDDSNDGTIQQPLKTSGEATRRAVQGGNVNLYFKQQQAHVAEFFMETGRVFVSSWGGLDTTVEENRPKLRARHQLDGAGDHRIYGIGVRVGQIFFLRVSIMCDNEELLTGTLRKEQSSFIQYADSNMSVILRECDINLKTSAFVSSHSGYSGRDIYLAMCTIRKLDGAMDGDRVNLLRPLSPANNTFRLDVYSCSLVNIPGGWAEILPPKDTGDINVLTNVSF
tara:strand:- start:472 stop:1314 length:843 start_codon:yes stop_codon:yes gene_type:complete